MCDRNKRCKKEVDVLDLQEKTVIDTAFNDKKWYCHKQTRTPYQPADMTNVTAKYELKHNVVQIKNCGLLDGEIQCVSFFHGKLPRGETKAKFTVKPWFVPGFFYRRTNYWILDQSNKHMIISEGNPKIPEPGCIRRPADGQGLWIMTNSNIRDNALIDGALQKIKELGINSEKMVDIDQK
jgi:hypothetical protein